MKLNRLTIWLAAALITMFIFALLSGCNGSDIGAPETVQSTSDVTIAETPSAKTGPVFKRVYPSAVPEDVPIPESTAEPSPEPSPEETPDNPVTPDIVPPVTVTFAGDVLIDEGVKRRYAEKGFEGIFSESGNTMKLSDIFMINLEAPFSVNGEAVPNKQYTYRADPEHISFLHEIGVDIVSIANNHTLDFGETAFLDTLGTLKSSDIRYVGGGRDLDEAGSYEIFEVNGVKIAFLAASRVLPNVDWYAKKEKPGLFATYDPRALISKITEAASLADYVAVYVHWGVMGSFVPEEWQREMAKQYIDAGASCVVGAHPHVLQGIEYYKDKPIIYSLGNFVFVDSNRDTATATVTFGEKISVSLKPYVIKSSRTAPAEDDESRQRILEHLRDVSFNVSIDDEFKVYPFEEESVS